MGVIDWVKQLRSGKENDDESKPLREFIYLDETSVVSLLASLEGEITESLITRSESVDRDLRKGKKGLAYNELGYSRTNESESIERSGSETIQRSVIQSRFDELHESRQDQLLLPSEDGVGLVDIERSEIIKFNGYVIVSEAYRVYKILEYLSETFEDIEKFGESVEDVSQEELEALSGFLSSLFGDQVPVRIEAANYRIVEDCIQHIQDLDSADEGEPLSIVGYLNRGSLWDDPLTVFSEDTEFTIYGRVVATDADWSPLRLTRVLEQHFPDQARQVNRALKNALLNLENIDEPSNISIDVEKNLEELLSDLEESLHSRDYPVGDTDLLSHTSAEMPPNREFGDYTEARDELDHVLGQLDLDLDSDEKAELLWNTIAKEDDPDEKKDSTGFEIKPIGIYW